ncbi:YecA family protein [Yoonia sp. GPGPB17]|uniref:YecA/YgfB family protein n=1 Tax=Yoonia sp. GPGPB17 TaxID=3026147 RepID=UPI0030C2BDC7
MPDLFQELDAYLQSEGSPPDCLMLSDLDGFLTGIACTPVPVANWADVAFGAGARVPPRIMQLTRKRLNDITASLSAEPGLLEPVFWQAPEGHAIAMDWCEGFMEAVKLNTVRWDKFAQSTTGAKLLMPILVHMFDDSGNSLFGIAQEDIDQTLEAAAEAIPQTVPLIYREMKMLG